MLATSSEDETIKLWDTKTGDLLRTIKAHNAWAYTVCFDPRGRFLASCGDDGTVKLWNLATGEEERIFRVECPHFMYQAL